LVVFFPGLAITEGRIPQNVTNGTHLQIVPSKEIGLGHVNDETFYFNDISSVANPMKFEEKGFPHLRTWLD
jgi:hypothetical protein